MIIFIIIIIIILILFLCLHDNKINKFTNTNYKYTAVIVEPRKHKALKYVLNNFLENLNDDWCVLIIHGNLNEDYVNDIINNDLIIYKPRIFTHRLPVDNLTIDDYNNLLKSIEFHNLILTEMFLVFQTDTIICNEFKDYIYKFMKYDYVGAPWNYGNFIEVGNGGLSLRRKSKMIDVINKCQSTVKNIDLLSNMNTTNEDVFFSLGCDKAQVYTPTLNEAKEFSVEQIYNPNSFGVHKAYANLNKKDMEKLKKTCPQFTKVIELNK